MILRHFYLVFSILIVAIAGLLGWLAVADPMDAERALLAREVANLPPPVLDDLSAETAPVWRDVILAKPAVWRELIAPGPAPLPAAPAAPKPPNLAEMLSGVRALTRGTATTVFMVWPGNEKGDFVSVGDKVKGCVIMEFDRTSVTFSYFWQQGNREFTYTIPRERRLN